MDTIFARSTAPGRSGVGVIRISGPRSWTLVERLTRRAVPAPRLLVKRKIWCSDEIVDIGMVVVFEDERSFTGERSAELHLHGSEAIARAVLAELGKAGDARMGRAGEFTHRALLRNKMDLSEVEGLGALLEAETEAQRRLAFRALNGGVRAQADGWRDRLVRALAAIEVTVDFADEDVPADVSADLADSLRRLAESFRQEAEGAVRAEKIARGFEVAIVGAPNAGKSTLLNRLAGRDAALTSEIAGTTRDIVEVRIEISGHLVSLLDTAGIREASDGIELAGIARARSRAEAADLRVFIDEVPPGITQETGDIVIRGKADLAPRSPAPGVLAVSGKSGEGVEALLSEIGARLSERVAGVGAAITARQAEALRAGAESLDEAADVLEDTPDRVEVGAQLIREGILRLDEVVGRVGVEDVLGEIFSRFCIGK